MDVIALLEDKQWTVFDASRFDFTCRSVSWGRFAFSAKVLIMTCAYYSTMRREAQDMTMERLLRFGGVNALFGFLSTVLLEAFKTTLGTVAA